jgi:hypothetical protein
MLVDAYRVRWKGLKQGPDEIRMAVHRGHLSYVVRLYDARPERRVMKAQLIAGDGETYVLPVLDLARVVTVRGDGILVTGIEIIPLSRGSKNVKTERYPQTWWCVKAF